MTRKGESNGAFVANGIEQQSLRMHRMMSSYRTSRIARRGHHSGLWFRWTRKIPTDEALWKYANAYGGDISEINFIP